MEFAIDYHMIFMVLSFMLLMLSVLLLFIDSSFEKTVASNIFIVFNFILCLLVSMGFGAIDFYGYDSSGNLVHNINSGMHPFIYIFWIIGYINIMLLFYCVYIYYKKPWDDYINTPEPSIFKY